VQRSSSSARTSGPNCAADSCSAPRVQAPHAPYEGFNSLPQEVNSSLFALVASSYAHRETESITRKRDFDPHHEPVLNQSQLRTRFTSSNNLLSTRCRAKTEHREFPERILVPPAQGVGAGVPGPPPRLPVSPHRRDSSPREFPRKPDF